MTRAYHNATLILIFLLAAWLGLSQLGEGMLWYDEWWSFWSAGGGHYGPLTFSQVIDRAVGEPSQPPLYYLMLWQWGKLAGWTPFAVRFLPLMFGLLTVAWTVRLGTDVTGDRRVGVLAALLLTTSALFVDYLHELRLYTMMTLFSVMSAATYWRVIQAKRLEITPSILFVVAVMGAVYAHLLTVLTLASIGAYHLFFVRKDRRWWQVTGLGILGALSILPWLGVTLGAVGTFTASGGRTDTAMDFGGVLWHLLYALSNGTFLSVGLVAIAWGIGYRVPLRRSRGTGFVLLLLALIFTQAIGLNMIAGVITHARYLLSLWPLWVIVAGLALHRAGQTGRIAKNFAIAIVGLWVVSGVFQSNQPAYYETLFRDVHTCFFRPDLPLDDFGRVVRRQAVVGDVVVLQASTSPWAISASFSVAVHGTPARYAILEEIGGADRPLVERTPAIESFLAGAARIWLAVDETFPDLVQEDLIWQYINRDYVLCEQIIDAPDMTAFLYAVHPVLCGETPDILADFGDGVQLKDAAFVSSDDQVTVYFSWHTVSVPSDRYSVGLYVFDAEGAFVAQGQDIALPLGAFNYAITTINTHGLPPGAYTVTTAVYRWDTGERLPVGTPLNDLPIGEFSLETKS